MNRSILLFLILLLTGAAFFVASGVAPGLAANPTVDCVPGATEIICTISDSAGIGAVQVEEYTAHGPLVVVTESYSACPAEVRVAWPARTSSYALTISDCAGAPAEVVYFGGLAHRALGEATLNPSPLALTATNFDREGDDGIAIDVGSASLWSGLLYPRVPAGGGGTFEASIFAEGFRAPVAQIQLTKAVTDVIVHLPPKDHSDDYYDVDLYREGTLVHSAEQIPNGTGYLSLLTPFCEGSSDLVGCVPRLTFGVDPADFRAYWEIHPPDPISVTVPSGVIGVDRLRFAESEGNLSPLHFTRVELAGTELPALTLFDQVVQAPLSEHSNFLPVIRNGGAADPFGFATLTAFMESDPAVDDFRQISPELSVRVVGPGQLIDEVVEMPSLGEGEEEGTPDPEERPVPSPSTQLLRVFNTSTQKEFEIEVGGELLAGLNRLVQGTGAPPDKSGALGVDGLLVRQRRAPDGWSDGVDNRVYLSGTTWWPWRTIVHFSNNCSGTLVGPRHILTAAHCINKRGTNQWYSFTVTPGRDGSDKPFGDAAMNPNPQAGDPFRWYFTPAGWRSSTYNDQNCDGSCFAASRHDWGLIIIPEYLGYQTGWMGYVARPASVLNYQSHFNRGYPVCGSGNGNSPDDCEYGELFGDTQTCELGNYSVLDGDGWNRLIRNSCDINGGHSGSPIYHYYYDPYLGKTVPVVAMVVIWEHCYTCDVDDDTPNTARRLTPSSIDIISFFRQWKP